MRLMIAALAAFFVSGCLTAQAQTDCRHVHGVPTAQLETEWAKYEIEWIFLDGPVRDGLVSMINGAEPRTDWAPPGVRWGYNEHAAAIVFDFADGCSWTTGAASHAEIGEILRRAQGVGL